MGAEVGSTDAAAGVVAGLTGLVAAVGSTGQAAAQARGLTVEAIDQPLLISTSNFASSILCIEPTGFGNKNQTRTHPLESSA